MDPLTIAFSLAQFAPQVLRWITGSDKAGDAAQAVVAIAQKATGRDTAEAAVQALQADPSAVQAFRQALAQQAHELDMGYLVDRADARRRDTALQQGGRRNVRADIMVAADAMGLIVCLVILGVYRQSLPGEAVALISTIASIFGLCLRDAHQFEFGSSRGSQEKTEMLAGQQRSGRE